MWHLQGAGESTREAWDVLVVGTIKDLAPVKWTKDVVSGTGLLDPYLATPFLFSYPLSRDSSKTNEELAYLKGKSKKNPKK